MLGRPEMERSDAWIGWTKTRWLERMSPRGKQKKSEGSVSSILMKVHQSGDEEETEKVVPERKVPDVPYARDAVGTERDRRTSMTWRRSGRMLRRPRCAQRTLSRPRVTSRQRLRR